LHRASSRYVVLLRGYHFGTLSCGFLVTFYFRFKYLKATENLRLSKLSELLAYVALL
jgi:hypothetical protein